MREQIVFCFLLSFLSCAFAHAPRKNCGDCTKFHSCSAAPALLGKNEPSANAKLQAAFCGYDNGGLPMVCCSELSTPEPTSSGVEGHPNLSLLPDACGDMVVTKLLGRNTASLYEYPWMVLVSFRIRIGLQFQCVGSLINDRYVLTAAHCVVGRELAGVRMGEHDIDSDTDCEGEPPNQICESNIQDIRIEQAIPHPAYQGKPIIRNDIALLRLKRPIVFSKNVRTICLPVTNEMQNRDVQGLYANVVGWGFTETGYTSSKLLVVHVPISTKQSCSEMYNRSSLAGVEDETENKLCAGTTARDSCGGDSGGPLMVTGSYKNSTEYRFIQHGIVSYGPKKCGSDFPGVYTDVTKYMKWILDTIKP